MKKYFIFLLCCYSLQAFAQDAAFIKINLQKNYLINELRNFHIGQQGVD
jgi:hypothetical protein